jgi:NodT family efflux transporter outer membrane factor (OMF) lipoprotein
MKQLALLAACVGVTLASGGCLNLKQAPGARTTSEVPVLQTWAKLNAENGGTIRDNWVASFSDPALNALVSEAMENNRDLQASAARRDQAIALAKRAGADVWPTVNLRTGGSAGGRSTGQSTGDVHLGMVASWELDLWGRVRYLTEAAREGALAAEADLEFARQSIAASVAETYYLAVANRLRLANSEALLKSQEEIDRIVQTKFKEGQTGRLESELSKADLAGFRADVQSRQSSYEEALRALEVLLGRFPSAEVSGAQTLPPPPGTVPAGIPSDLLERRPDIIAAEHMVASAFYQTESARMNLLPRIALTADGGYASTQLEQLLDHHNAAFSVGGSLLQPLFDAGARFADIEAAKAVQRQALALYASTALRAFQEIQNGLANELYFRERSAQLQLSTASMDTAYGLADTRYKAGEVTLLNLKQVQTQAYDTKDAAITAQFGQIQQRIRLYQALGGSIIADSPAPAPNTVVPPPTTQPASK